MRGENKFLNLAKATRFRRCLPSLMAILIFPAYANKFPITILILIIVAASLYSLTSIHNAYRDNDYILPSYFPIILIVGIIITIVIAATNKIILITTLLAIVLGYIYNTASRFVILGDSLIAGITHYILPIVASALLVEANPLPIAPLFYLFIFSLMPISNLKDIKKDKTLQYKTLVGSVSNPLWTATALSNLAFITTFIIFLFLKINIIFLIPLFLFQLLITYAIHTNKKMALELTRLHLLTIFIIIILNQVILSEIVLVSITIFTMYLILFILDIKKIAKND